MHAHYTVFNEQLKALAKSSAEELAADTPLAEMCRCLEALKSMGPKTSRTLSAAVFGWRTFANTKQVGAFAGLTPTLSQSGDFTHKQELNTGTKVTAITHNLEPKKTSHS